MTHTPFASPLPPPTSQAVDRLLARLAQKRLFKLIGGGSLTETANLAAVARAYAASGADCIDIAPDVDVIEAVATALHAAPDQSPVLMVSVPLDPDPHFRKIELAEPDCTGCGLCLPLCPTEAITLSATLDIAQALCYGCGRCVPACPTAALSLLPFQVEAQLADALGHPAVQAVEIHSHYGDPAMLTDFLRHWDPLLQNKLLSLCFRPQTLPDAQVLAFYQVAANWSARPVILQVDGAPMSGNDDPDASRPALEAAVHVRALFESVRLPTPFITISGGINRHTARHLQAARYDFIAGVGMGTVARQAVWGQPAEQAEALAASLMQAFRGDWPEGTATGSGPCPSG